MLAPLASSKEVMIRGEVRDLLVKVWVVFRSTRVTVPAGMVALVVPVVVRVRGEVPAVAKLPARVSVPVVQVGAPVPPEIKA